MTAGTMPEIPTISGVSHKFDIPAQEVDTERANPLEQQKTFCLRFSPDNQYLAASYGDGTIGIFSTTNGRRTYTLTTEKRAFSNPLPITQIRWRPLSEMSKTKNVLVSVTAEGIVQHWHITSGKVLHEIEEPGNQLYCMDYFHDGSLFATAGKSRQINIYDEATKRLSQTLAGGDMVKSAGHSNRVFSVKWHPTDKNILVTGGWDNTVQFWDRRKGHSVRSVYGPHICGDAIDISLDGKQLVTGSWRAEQQLQLWDIGSGELIQGIDWNSGRAFDPREDHDKNCMVYATQFSKDPHGDTIVAGGSVSNEVRLFDRKKNYEGFATIPAPKACYTLDISTDSSLLAFSGADAHIRVMNIKCNDGES